MTLIKWCCANSELERLHCVIFVGTIQFCKIAFLLINYYDY